MGSLGRKRPASGPASRGSQGGGCPACQQAELKDGDISRQSVPFQWTNCILKSRDIALPTKVRLVKAMVFPVVIYGCESWTMKKLSAEELMLLKCGVGEDS